MRIIAGTLRRRLLRAPKGNLTRPTTDRAREAIFNLISSRLDLTDACVLDLFAGTGALGLEALSRGAETVTFIERQPEVLRYARQNAADLDVASASRFVRADAVAFLKGYTGPPFDLALADPPYTFETLSQLPDLVVPLLAPHGLFVLEHDIRHRFDDHLHLDTSRPYGRTVVSVFRRHGGKPEAT
jgi:16S rRNA (guanine966-N2)-methyltransferase